MSNLLSRTRTVLALALTLIIGAPLTAQQPLEFHFTYRPAAYDALERHIGDVSLVIPEWFSVDGEGRVSGEVEARVLELAAAHGVPVMPQVKNLDRGGAGFRADWAHDLLSRPEARARAVAALLELCRAHGLYGIQIELEGVHVSDRDGLSAFVREAADALRAEGYRVSVSAIHREEDGPGPTSYTAWMWEHWRGVYDLEALGEAADFVRAVVFAQHTRRTPPGPSQGLPWLERVMERFVAAVPPEKLNLDLAMGAMRWYVAADPERFHINARAWSESVTRAEARQLIETYGGPPLRWDERQKTSYSYFERGGVFEWLFVDNDVRGFDARVALARRLGIPAVSLWVTGDEDPAMWTRFEPAPVGQGTAGPATASPPAGGIPVLAWHYFVDEVGPDDGALTTSFAEFEAMLRFLRERGFRSVMPEEATLPGHGGGRQVVLTFDDGQRGSLRAAELLERYGFRGIFFVVPTRVAEGSEFYMSPAEVERLARAGHRIAAHGYDHLSLAYSGEETAASLRQATELLSRYLEPDPSTLDFAFPFGHYSPAAASALTGAYRHLHTVNPGYWDGRSPMLPRMLILRGVDPGLYREYALGAAGHSPALVPLTPDGAVVDTVLFRIEGNVSAAGLELLAVSADAAGRSYASHPLGQDVRVEGDTLVLDLRAHMARFHSPDRLALAYAIVRRQGDGVEYLSPGLLHWLGAPGGGPRLRR